MFVGRVKITSEMMANWQDINSTPEERKLRQEEDKKRLEHYLEEYAKFAEAYPELAKGVVATYKGKDYP
jgi:phage terminase small subunit